MPPEPILDVVFNRTESGSDAERHESANRKHTRRTPSRRREIARLRASRALPPDAIVAGVRLPSPDRSVMGVGGIEKSARIWRHRPSASTSDAFSILASSLAASADQAPPASPFRAAEMCAAASSAKAARLSYAQCTYFCAVESCRCPSAVMISAACTPCIAMWDAGPSRKSSGRPSHVRGSANHVGHSRILMRSSSTIQSCWDIRFVANSGMSLVTTSRTLGLSCRARRSTTIPAAVAGG